MLNNKVHILRQQSDANRKKAKVIQNQITKITHIK